MKEKYEVTLPQPLIFGSYVRGKDIAQVRDKIIGLIYVAKKVKASGSDEFKNMRAGNH